MGDGFFDHIYDAETPEEVQGVYDRFARDYDAAVTENGYATPARLAAMLSAKLPDMRDKPLLDFGCGTGLSGLALAAEGFAVIDGCDPSQAMIDQSRERGVYRHLWSYPLAQPPDPKDLAEYPVFAAVGVVSVGAAPPDVLAYLIGALTKGSHLIFSYNSHTLEDETYMDALAAAKTDTSLKLLAEESGPHLPALGLTSTIYLFQSQ